MEVEVAEYSKVLSNGNLNEPENFPIAFVSIFVLNIEEYGFYSRLPKI